MKPFVLIVAFVLIVLSVMATPALCQTVSESYIVDPSIDASSIDQLILDVSYPYDEPSTDGLIVKMDFDDNYLDSSGNGHDVFVHGNNISFVHGKKNNGTQFDGIGDYLDLGNYDDFTQKSVSVWLKVPAHDGVTRVIYDAGYLDRGYGDHIYQSSYSDAVQFFVKNTSGYYSWSYAYYVPDEWFHVAYSWDGVDVKTYVNGLWVDVDALTGTLSGATNFTLGYSDVYSYSGATIDQFYVYDYPLSQTEVLAHYHNPPSQLTISTTTNPLNTTTYDYGDALAYVPTLSNGVITGLNFSQPDTIIVGSDVIYDSLPTTVFSLSITNTYLPASMTSLVSLIASILGVFGVIFGSFMSLPLIVFPALALVTLVFTILRGFLRVD